MSQIHYPKAFVQSAQYNGSLWKYPSDSMMGSDMDQIAERNGYFLIAESKKFDWDEKVTLPFGQIHMLRHLNDALPKRKIFIVGTNSYNAVNDDDHIWFRTLDDDNLGAFESKALTLQKSQMIKTSKREFNRIANHLVSGVNITV